MKSAAVTAGTIGTASEYNNLRQDAYGGSQLFPHAQSTPGMTIKIENGRFYLNNTNTFVEYAGGNSPTITAPVSNPRIDVISITTGGTIVLTNGSEAASPTAPAVPTGNLPICQIFNRVGESVINDLDAGGSTGYIYKDTRIFLQSTNVVAVIPTMKISTIFESNANSRFTVGAAPTTFGSGGVVISGASSGTTGSLLLPAPSGTLFNEFTGNPIASFVVSAISPNPANTQTVQWFCIGGSPITTFSTSVTKHIGFKLTWGSGAGTGSLFATQADGTTENVSAALLTGIASGDSFEFIIQVKGTTVTYYWRHNGGAISSTTLTGNVPTGSAGNGIMFFSIGAGSGNGGLTVGSMSYER